MHVTHPAAGDAADALDEQRLAHVRPPGWRNPRPAAVYDLVVLGGGTAGLVCAMGAAGLGARVALVERHLLGGECLNSGCVPSKAIIRSARAAAEARGAAAFGIRTGSVTADTAAVMQRMRARRTVIAAHDAAERFRRAGVDLFLGRGRFTGRTVVDVADDRLHFRRAVVATGSTPALPPISGLGAVPLLTTETIFELGRLPDSVLIVGGGPVGCELAQALARLGSFVTLVERAARVLDGEDPDAAHLVRTALERDGVRVETGSSVRSVAFDGRAVSAALEPAPGAAGAAGVTADALLVAAGRRPVIDELGLDAAGIAATRDGIVVNDWLQTTNRRVYAAGDVCTRVRFTHAADAMARIVVQNALFFGRRRVSALMIPRVTYTDPEVAHVGLGAGEVAASHKRVSTITVPLTAIDRAVLDDDTEGFVRVHHERGRIRGCTIVSSHAGELIAGPLYAVAHGGTLGRVASIIHPYPTVAEGLRQAGDMYRRQALTPRVRRWLERYFAWTR